MHLSISSFDPRDIGESHVRILLVGMLAGLLLVLGFENLLRYKGLERSIRDTPGLWASQRALASRLGKDDFILVGASRIQLGLDTSLLRQETGHKVAQLAVDGEPMLQVLANLADDPAVDSRVIIGAGLPDFARSESMHMGKLISNYNDKYRGLWLPPREEYLSALMQSVSVLYANSIPPLELLELTVTRRSFSRMYLITHPDRSRDADYRRVAMPGFYVERVVRTLGFDPGARAFHGPEMFEQEVIAQTEKTLRPFDTSRERFTVMMESIRKLQARGARVYIINFPVSGLVREIEERRYPQEAWKAVTGNFAATAIDYRDYPQLQFELADGSHLDHEQKRYFTHELLAIIRAGEASAAGPHGTP